MPDNKLTILEQDELQAEKRAQLQRDSEDALAEDINLAYAALVEMGQDAYNLVLRAENQRIALGHLLHVAKGQIGHGKWLDWQKENLPFSHDYARKCIKIAEQASFQPLADLNSLKEFHKVLVYMGLKAAAEGHGPQQLHDFNAFATFTNTILATRKKITEIFEKEPLDEWEDDAKEQLKEQLVPIVELYESL